MILCLETSAKACSVAISSEGQTLVHKIEEGEWRHSQIITLLIQDVLTTQSVHLSDLHAVAVSQGPGSYTGLRVGASCAKGLCYALDIPLISVPTLELVAFPFTAAAKSGQKIIPMIDARRQEVYYNIYDAELNAGIETTNLVLDDSSFEAYEDKTIIFCGDGAHKMRDLVPKEADWMINPSIPQAKDMAALAYDRYKAGKLEDTAYYVPFYLKPPNITKSKKPLF